MGIMTQTDGESKSYRTKTLNSASECSKALSVWAAHVVTSSLIKKDRSALKLRS